MMGLFCKIEQNGVIQFVSIGDAGAGYELALIAAKWYDTANSVVDDALKYLHAMR